MLRKFKRFGFLLGVLPITLMVSSWFLLNLHHSPSSKSGHQCTTTVTKPKSPNGTSPNKSIDMVNDYQPSIDFKFIFPETMPDFKGPRDMFLIILVNSGAKGDVFRKRRNNIRATWGSHETCEQSRITRNPKLRSLTWILVFVVGKAGPGSNDDKRNKEEATRHNDMLIGNIEDNYLNNIIKLYMGQMWAAMSTAKYTLKTDDDVYVRIPRVIEYLANLDLKSRFYGGATYGRIEVDRRAGGKWAVSWMYFPERAFPPFNPGAFILISTDLLPSLFNYVYIRKPFHTDDAYIGVAMRDMKIKVTKIYSFAVTIDKDVDQVIRKRTNCQTLALIAVGHKVEPKSSKFLHGRIETFCNKNITTKSC